jgi:carboxyl-terminal processing protease
VIAAGRFLMALLLGAGVAFAAAPLAPRQQAEDFEAMWRAVDGGYAYFDAGRGAWKRARDAWKPRAARAATRADFVAALEGALEQLRDDHVSLSEQSARARRVPYESDVWARWKEGRAVVESVRTFSDADVAGLHPGQVVLRVDGVPVERAVRRRLGPTPPDANALDWGLRQVLAGPRSGIQRLDVRNPGGQPGDRPGSDPGVALAIERSAVTRGNAPPVLARRMGEERDIGYVRLRIGSGDARLVEQFEGAFNYLKDTRALIVDLRETAGPGSRAETEAILARFGGTAYRGPVMVLVDRWTAGEGEALAAGLRAAANARIVGTAMAGLRGELREVTLPHSGIVVSFPAKRAFLANGAPRESLTPDVPVDLAAPLGGPGDPILYQALKLVEPCPGPACRNAPGSPPPARGSPRR